MGEDLTLALALEGRVEAARAETRKLIALAGTLAALPDPEIDATFAASLEARLLTEGLEDAPMGRPHLTVVSAIPATPADEVVRRAPVVQMARRRHTVRRSIVAVAAAASLAAFPVAASASSLPGSPLHKVKRGIENTRLALFGTPLEDGFYHMHLAQMRAEEVNQLIALGASQARIGDGVQMAEDHMRKGTDLVFDHSSDALDLSRLASMARKTEAEMRKARQALGGSAGTITLPAIETSEDIQSAVKAALGLPFTAEAVTAPADGPIFGGLDPVESQSGTDAGKSTQPKRTEKSDEGGSSGSDRDDPTGGHGAKQVREAADQGCAVVGGAQGLGDLTAPLTRVTCTQD